MTTLMDVTKAFVSQSEEMVRTTNCRTINKKLFSYATCIAQWLTNRTIIINATSYSVTTNKHQNCLSTCLYPKRNIKRIYVYNVDRNTPDLRYHLPDMVKKQYKL